MNPLESEKTIASTSQRTSNLPVRVRSCRVVVQANRSQVFPRAYVVLIVEDNKPKHHAHSRQQRGRIYGRLGLLLPKSCDTRV